MVTLPPLTCVIVVVASAEPKILLLGYRRYLSYLSVFPYISFGLVNLRLFPSNVVSFPLDVGFVVWLALNVVVNGGFGFQFPPSVESSFATQFAVS